MNELQQLEAKIREALPRLQELNKHLFTDAYKHQIYLSDVLEWLDSLQDKSDFKIYSTGALYKYDETFDNYYYAVEYDLSKPLLKDQPKEVIEYLNNLK